MERFRIRGPVLFRALAFMLIFFCLLKICDHIFQPKENSGWGNYDSGGVYGIPQNTADILVLGSSNAPEGFAAPALWGQYGYSAYVWGKAWGITSDMYVTLIKVLKNQTPKLLILETDCLYSSKEKGIAEMEHALQNLLESVFPTFQYHNRFKNLAWQDFVKAPHYTYMSPTNGYSGGTAVTPFGNGYMVPSSQIERPDRTSRFFLDRMVQLCRQKGISLLLVSVPSQNWNMPRHNGMEAVSREYGIPYLDYNLHLEQTGFDWSTDSRDGSHLNYFGAKKIIAAIGSYLSEHYQFPDHRGEAGYEKWEESYQYFQKQFSGK